MWGRGSTPSCPQTRPTCQYCSAFWSSPCLTLSPMLCFPVMIEAWSRANIYVSFIFFFSWLHNVCPSAIHIEINSTHRVYELFAYTYCTCIWKISIDYKVWLIIDLTQRLSLVLILLIIWGLRWFLTHILLLFSNYNSFLSERRASLTCRC